MGEHFPTCFLKQQIDSLAQEWSNYPHGEHKPYMLGSVEYFSRCLATEVVEINGYNLYSIRGSVYVDENHGAFFRMTNGYFLLVLPDLYSGEYIGNDYMLEGRCTFIQ